MTDFNVPITLRAFQDQLLLLVTKFGQEMLIYPEFDSSTEMTIEEWYDQWESFLALSGWDAI